MQSRMIQGGGVFDVASSIDASTSRDLAQFKTVGAQPWPPGDRSAVKPAGIRRDIGYSKVGMGGVFGQAPAPVSAAVARRIAPVDPRATMLSRVSPFDMTGAVRSLPGFTPKGGILDGATVGTGQPGQGQYFEAREPKVIGTGVKVRSLPDPMIALRNLRQASIMPMTTELTDARTTRKIAPAQTSLAAKILPTVKMPRPSPQNKCPPGFTLVVDLIEGPKCVQTNGPKPPQMGAKSCPPGYQLMPPVAGGPPQCKPIPGMNGFGAAHDVGRRPLPVSVSFAHPRMYGRSVFEGPVVGDRMPKQSLQPPFKPVSGFGAGPDGLGAGPDGLGSGCGCGGGWNYSG